MFSTKNVPAKISTGKKVLIYICWKSAYHTKVKNNDIDLYSIGLTVTKNTKKKIAN